MNGKNPIQLSAILLPEYTFLVDPMRDRRVRTQVESLAKEVNAVLVFGAKDYFDPADPNRYRNTAYVLGPDGKLLGTHVKNHPIHFFNDGVRGKEAKAIDTPMGRIGVAICFDMDYPEVARKLAQDGAEVFLVPNMDPPHWGRIQREQHRLMFAMRAAECGKWLARADVAGGTSVVDPLGREIRRVNTQEAQLLDVRVQLVTGKTIYVRFGWMLGPGCLILSGLLLVTGLVRSRQTIRS